jgi:hypothetical protein
MTIGMCEMDLVVTVLMEREKNDTIQRCFYDIIDASMSID